MSEKTEVVEVQIDEVELNPYQPRREFGEKELEQLARSIESVGLLHPPLVRRSGRGYELISGERRLRAAQIAGLRRIPVMVRAVSDETSADAALVENVQRVDLNAVELAEGLQRLIDEFGYSQHDLAKRLGKRRSTVANYLRLLGLSKEAQEALAKREITIAHAKVILSVEGEVARRTLLRKIVSKGLSVKQSEQAAQEGPKKEAVRDIHAEVVVRQLEHVLGTTVALQTRSSGGGKIVIDYYDLDDLDRLVEKLT